MNRKVLLVEPNYKNKYPPMGLMKLATYHRMLGDDVTFFKGDISDLILSNIFTLLKNQLYAVDDSVFWEKYTVQICKFLKTGSQTYLDNLPHYRYESLIQDLLLYYRKYYYKNEYLNDFDNKYDRICITTLFTFYWDITVDTINTVKKLCKSLNQVFIGGIMSSILPDQIFADTGIKPIVGTLNQPGVLDAENNLIIDTLPLDYSILEEIEYEYPASDAYYAYTTRGCVNKCPFCAVPKLEPTYVGYMPLADKIARTAEIYGSKKDLLLLDNNVLASDYFDQIIDEIKKCGFSSGNGYIRENLYELAVKNLRMGVNDKAYVRLCVKEFRKLIKKHRLFWRKVLIRCNRGVRLPVQSYFVGKLSNAHKHRVSL